MAPINLAYLMRATSRGRIFWYYRRDGQLTRIPGQPGEAAFLAEYQRVHAMHGDPGRPLDAPGSLAALIAAYKASAEWKNLRPATRTDYLKALDPLHGRYGHLPVKTMPREFVMRLKDQYAEKDGVPTPRRANRMIAVLRLLLSWGVDRGWRRDNPALRPRLLPTHGGYRPWTEREVAAFLASAPAELAFAARLALATGQRKGDLLRLTWSAWDGSAIEVVQAKTGARLWIPAHRELRAALAAAPRRATTILTRPDGKPWREDHFSHAFGQAVKEAGLQGLVFHGLRHTAATWLAEAGATPHQIAAITGHRTLAMITRYTRDSDQRKHAGEAIRLLDKRATQNASRTTSANRGANRAPKRS